MSRVVSILIAVLCLAAAPHDNSWSQSLVVVRADGLTVFLRVQQLSAAEIPGVDSNADGWLDADEFAAGRDALLGHLESSWTLRTTRDSDAPPLSLELTRFELVEQGSSALDLQRFVEAEWRWAGAPPELLRLDMSLFVQTSPLHIDTARVTWPDGRVEDARTWAGKASHVFVAPEGALDAAPDGAPANVAATNHAAPPVPGAPAQSASGVAPSFLDDLHLGVEHMLTGWDHLAFLLGLLAACAGWRALLALVTAFTLAHSATLALAAYDLVRLPAAPVELGIAVSIAYVGAVSLFASRPRTLMVEAAVFGLVHGLGFASQLARQLSESASPLQLLVSFNLGLELGQLAVVFALVLLLRVLRLRGEPVGEGDDARRWLMPRALRKASAAGVLLAGLWWSYERVGEFGWF